MGFSLEIWGVFWGESSIQGKNDANIFHYKSELEKTEKLFPVSFKLILKKVDSYLRQVQTSDIKSIVLFDIIKNHLTEKTSNIRFPIINQHWKRLEKLFPVTFQMHLILGVPKKYIHL